MSPRLVVKRKRAAPFSRGTSFVTSVSSSTGALIAPA